MCFTLGTLTKTKKKKKNTKKHYKDVKSCMINNIIYKTV